MKVPSSSPPAIETVQLLMRAALAVSSSLTGLLGSGRARLGAGATRAGCANAAAAAREPAISAARASLKARAKRKEFTATLRCTMRFPPARRGCQHRARLRRAGQNLKSYVLLMQHGE